MSQDAPGKAAKRPVIVVVMGVLLLVTVCRERLTLERRYGRSNSMSWVKLATSNKLTRTGARSATAFRTSPLLNFHLLYP